MGHRAGSPCCCMGLEAAVVPYQSWDRILDHIHPRQGLASPWDRNSTDPHKDQNAEVAAVVAFFEVPWEDTKMKVGSPYPHRWRCCCLHQPPRCHHLGMARGCLRPWDGPCILHSC